MSSSPSTANHQPPLEPLLNVEEVAAYLGVPASTVYAWRSGGRPCPPATKLGRHLRFRRADVEAWVAERQAAHTDGGVA